MRRCLGWGLRRWADPAADADAARNAGGALGVPLRAEVGGQAAGQWSGRLPARRQRKYDEVEGKRSSRWVLSVSGNERGLWRGCDNAHAPPAEGVAPPPEFDTAGPATGILSSVAGCPITAVSLTAKPPSCLRARGSHHAKAITVYP